MVWTLVGSVAAAITTLGFLPQIVKMRRNHSVRDVSGLYWRLSWTRVP